MDPPPKRKPAALFLINLISKAYEFWAPAYGFSNSISSVECLLRRIDSVLPGLAISELEFLSVRHPAEALVFDTCCLSRRWRTGKLEANRITLPTVGDFTFAKTQQKKKKKNESKGNCIKQYAKQSFGFENEDLIITGYVAEEKFETKFTKICARRNGWMRWISLPK